MASVSGVPAQEIVASVEAAAGRAASESAGEAVAVRLDLETGRFHRAASEAGETELEGLARPVVRAARGELEDRLRQSRLLAGGERFRDRIGKLETGRVLRREGADLIVDLGASVARLPANEQSRHEVFNPDDTVRAVVVALRPEEPPVILSRIAPEVVAGALEREAPEVRSGIVRVRGVARLPGVRAKAAVSAERRDVDPVACCLGPGGSRIRAVSRELRGERVDVVRWHPDPAVFARHALRPAEVLSVGPDPDSREPGALLVLVAEEELPRTLGKRGQNVRLAADLLGAPLEVRAPEEGGTRAGGSARGRGPRPPMRGREVERRPRREDDDRRRFRREGTDRPPRRDGDDRRRFRREGTDRPPRRDGDDRRRFRREGTDRPPRRDGDDRRRFRREGTDRPPRRDDDRRRRFRREGTDRPPRRDGDDRRRFRREGTDRPPRRDGDDRRRFRREGTDRPPRRDDDRRRRFRREGTDRPPRRDGERRPFPQERGRRRPNSAPGSDSLRASRGPEPVDEQAPVPEPTEPSAPESTD